MANMNLRTTFILTFFFFGSSGRPYSTSTFFMVGLARTLYFCWKLSRAGAGSAGTGSAGTGSSSVSSLTSSSPVPASPLGGTWIYTTESKLHIDSFWGKFPIFTLLYLNIVDSMKTLFVSFRGHGLWWGMFHASYPWSGPQLSKACGWIGVVSPMHKKIPESYLLCYPDSILYIIMRWHLSEVIGKTYN